MDVTVKGTYVHLGICGAPFSGTSPYKPKYLQYHREESSLIIRYHHIHHWNSLHRPNRNCVLVAPGGVSRMRPAAPRRPQPKVRWGLFWLWDCCFFHIYLQIVWTSLEKTKKTRDIQDKLRFNGWNFRNLKLLLVPLTNYPGDPVLSMWFFFLIFDMHLWCQPWQCSNWSH